MLAIATMRRARAVVEVLEHARADDEVVRLFRRTVRLDRALRPPVPSAQVRARLDAFHGQPGPHSARAARRQ